MTNVSIVVPIYKIEQFLPECINSILAQTYQDWECILVDDGSPDNSSRIADEYAARDKRIKAIHVPNGGVTAARRIGVDCAKGEWVFFVDGDDRVEPDGLRQLVEYADQHPDTDIIEGSYLWFFPDNTVKYHSTKADKDGMPIIFNGEKYSLSLYIYTFGSRGPWSKIIRKSVIDKSKAMLIPRSITNREDALMMTIIAKGINKYALLPVAVYQYRSQYSVTAVSNPLSWNYWTEYLRYLDQEVFNDTTEEWEEVFVATAVDVFKICVHGNTKIEPVNDYFRQRVIPALIAGKKDLNISERSVLWGSKKKLYYPVSWLVQTILRTKNSLFHSYYAKRSRKE